MTTAAEDPKSIEEQVRKALAQIQAAVDANPGALFCDLGGMVACPRHLGMEGQSALVRHPKAKRLTTSMTVWERVSQEEKDAALKEFGEPMDCEHCKWLATKEATPSC